MSSSSASSSSSPAASTTRISIPKNVKNIIQNIKEIAGNHSDDEIYAMLKECSMDPNETAQKLLLQDTFHEVRRKRDKKKEIPNSREAADSRLRLGTQGRGSRGARGNYSPRYFSHDVGVGRNASTGKENGLNQDRDKSATLSSLPASQETDSKAPAPASSSAFVANGPSNAAVRSSGCEPASQMPAGRGATLPKGCFDVTINKLGNASRSSPVDVLKISVSGISSTPGQTSLSGVYSSASDPVLVPSFDSRTFGALGTIKREVGFQRTTIQPNATAERKTAVSRGFPNRVQVNRIVSDDVNMSLSKDAPEVCSSFMHGKMPSKSLGLEKNPLSESSRPSSSSTHGGSSTSRPSSNYSSRSQQLIGSQKVGPSKEWKPKPTTAHPAPPQSTATSEVLPVMVEDSTPLMTTSSAPASEESSLKLQKKLQGLHFLDGQHVIIPDHLHVPEAQRTGLSFGSFDASFGITPNGPDKEKSSTPLSESSQGVEETAEEPSSSNQSGSQTAREGDCIDHPQSPNDVLENESPGEVDASSNSIPEYDISKPEAAIPTGVPQYSVVHTAPYFSNFGFMPPLPTHFAPIDSSDAQSRDISRLQNIVVHQPFDPAASYYNQFYRPGVDADGRFCPAIAPGAVLKYNGNMAPSSIQSGQSPQESGSSLVLSTAGPTLMTQAAGVMQSSIPITPQPVSVFRQPAGVHIPQYPHGYIPYNQFFPPYFGPPPAIHQFLSNPAFPQQASASNLYQSPTAAAATGVKPSLSQYKPGTNAGNSTHNGMPTGYGPYCASPGGYSPTSASTTGNSTGNEEHAASQYKENNIYTTGQQSESQAGWIPGAGRDTSGLQPNSFYNLPPQGQHMAFAPPQGGHGAFPGVYHSVQTVPSVPVHPLLQQSQTVAGAVDMGGSTSGVYQQPQRTTMNWNNTY